LRGERCSDQATVRDLTEPAVERLLWEMAVPAMAEPLKRFGGKRLVRGSAERSFRVSFRLRGHAGHSLSIPIIHKICLLYLNLSASHAMIYIHEW
jgi:hypothetical protein